MLSWKNVIGLSVGEEDAAQKVETFIDAGIAEEASKSLLKRSFSVNRAALGESLKAQNIDGLTIKVKAHVLGKYVKDGWQISENQHCFILTAPLPKKRGGRAKKVQTETVQPSTAPATPTDAAPVPAAETPAESPAQAITV
jgi:hypothetical protein